MKPYGWLLSALALLCFSVPAEAARLLSWEFEKRENRLIFVTDESVLPKARLLSNPTRLVIDLPDVDLARNVATQEQVGGAIAAITTEQLDADNSRLTITLAPGYEMNPQEIEIRGLSLTRWQVSLPTPRRTVSRDLPPVPSLPAQRNTTPTTAQNTNAAIVNALEIGTGNQLLIRADRAIAGTGRWSLEERAYQILIPNAQYSPRLRQPRLVGVPISQIRLRQRGDTLEILVYPAARHEVRRLEQLGRNLLGVELRQSTVGRVPVPPTTNPRSTNPRSTNPRPTTNPNPSPLPRPTGNDLVVIDPGHGGKDPGAIGIGGLREKDVVLPISLEISRTLQQQGVRVLMTRSDDRFISLAGRTQIANRARADVFVSIHANAISLSRPDVNGVETYYHNSGARLAQTVHQSILRNISIGNRGVKRARFYVLRNSSMPAILVEVGFVTGRDDAPRLADPAFRSQMAQAISEGILRYLQ